MFWKVEGRTGLYVFFKTVCDIYGLIPEDNYTIPAEAEGIEPPTETRSSNPPLILKREPSEPSAYESDTGTMLDHSLSSATTKRHRHSPSVGATTVQTVVEEAEEEEERPVLQSRPVTQIFESGGEDEDDITVIEDGEEVDEDGEEVGETEAELEEVTGAAGESIEEGTDETSESKSEDAEKPADEGAKTEGVGEGGDGDASKEKVVDDAAPKTEEASAEESAESAVPESAATAAAPDKSDDKADEEGEKKKSGE